MNQQIATYSFLPWVRQGIASRIEGGDNLGVGAGIGERASVSIVLNVNGDPNFVSQQVQLISPGDVIGISPRAIVRTEPRNWVTDFEPNYLAFIEFYDEDFPWRYTPARAVHRDHTGSPVNDSQHTKLRPWIFLLVLQEDEFEPVVSTSSPLPTIKLAETVFMESLVPPPNQTWAWAHAHVSRDVIGNTAAQTMEALTGLVRQNPDYALSRLLSPRKLRPSTAYHAFVIPTFEAGRLAGLGKPTASIDALAPAWGADQREFPVYYRWFFRTGARGDFEFLVKLLQAREVDKRVGIRDMDMVAPGYRVRGMSSAPGDFPVMGLEGALKSPQAQPKPDVFPPPDPANYPAFLNDLTEVVNLQDTLLNGADAHPDPIISPPLYGRWHGLQNRLETGQPGWVNQLNQDPRLRVPAGFGTNVIQKEQERYMQRAWQQLGEVLRANQKIRQVQVSIAASSRVFARHFLTLEPDEQIALTQQVHVRVLDNQMTVAHQIKSSRVPQAAVKPTFRRILRPRGAVVRKADATIRPADLLVKLNAGTITAALSKRAPLKQISLSRLTSAFPDHPLREENLTARAIADIPKRINFQFTTRGETSLRPAERIRDDDIPEPGEIPPRRPPGRLPPVIEPEEAAEVALFRTAVLDLHSLLETALPAPEVKPQMDTGGITGMLTRALNPKVAILQRVLSILQIPPTAEDGRAVESIEPIMAHPVFSDPMYKPLRDLSSELLLPNLGLIPNNTITLLETNPEFIEAYMVGLNHEMGRELLWREYPTDQRGSYFRQFWDAGEIVNRGNVNARTLEEARADIKPLHTWARETTLGTHSNRSLPTGNEADARRLVLVVRGDLLTKYPTAVIYARRAVWAVSEINEAGVRRYIRVLDEGDPAVTTKEPIFKAEIEPDIRFLGFDLTFAEAKGDPTPPRTTRDSGHPGWFFVIQERPGEPRFAMDVLEGEAPALQLWDDLSWNHLSDQAAWIDMNARLQLPTNSTDSRILWGSNAADMAYILFQDPVMVAVHADNMLE
jgi:hypothetical protein